MKETKINKYKPTAKEEAILRVMLNPENISLSITDIALKAPCSRKTYYAAFRKPQFVNHYKERAKGLIDEAVGPIISKFIKVDQIRDLIDFVHKMAQQGGRRVVILAPAERMIELILCLLNSLSLHSRFL